MGQSHDNPALDPTAPAGHEAVEVRTKAGDTVPGAKRLEERRCGRCGTSVPTQFHFCGTCGFNLSDDADGRADRDPLIGVVVGDRYRLLRRIGIGGMGTVYKAEHVRMGKVVAVKLLHGDLSRDVSAIRRFTREARAASKLSDPHTVTVFDYGQSEGLVYLVMEYLQGRDLGQIIREQGPLGLATTARIVEQVADSLGEAHSHGIIHRDLKPENIFVLAGEDEGAERIKVVDFGLAKIHETREESLVTTSRGNIIGTPYYMSPEQISGGEVDVHSDVYSLAAVTFKLLTGLPPFQHENPVAILSKHLTAPVPSPSEHDASLSVVDEVLRKALAKRPQDRFGSVAELSRELQRAIQSPQEAGNGHLALGVGTTSREVVPTREEFDRFERRLKAKRFITALLPVLLLAAGAYLFWWGVIERGLSRSESESEPNDTPQNATRIYFDEPLTGTIGRPTMGDRADDDFYLIENDTSGPIVLRAELTGVPGLDLVLKTYDEDARELVAVNSGAEGDAEVLPNLILENRYSYLQVREYWVRDRPARHNEERPYRLTVSYRPPGSGEEAEPNDRLTDGLQVRLGETYIGWVGWAGDRDVYRLPEIPAGGRLVAASAQAPPGLDLELDLLDRSGNILRQLNRSPAGVSEEMRVFVSAEGHGAVSVAVTGAEGDWESEEAYRVTLDLVPVEGLHGPR